MLTLKFVTYWPRHTWKTRNLEIQFQAKLNNSRVAGRSDGTKARRSRNRCGRSQRRRISHVKYFSAKFDVAILAEVSALY